MKKIFAVFATLCLCSLSVFAQSTSSALPDDDVKVDLSKKIINPTNQHLLPEDKTGKVVIEYTPMVDEVRIYYTSMYNLYEPGNAMNAIIGCLEDFVKENHYYNYRYIDRDRERYFKDERGIRWAQYISHVKLTR